MINLVANQKYYFEYLFKEGGGGDNSGVAWKKATDPDPANNDPEIPGTFLSVEWPTVLTFQVQPTNQTVSEGQFVSFRAIVLGVPGDSDTTLFTYQWYVNNTPITDGTGNSATYQILSAAATDNGKQYKVGVASARTYDVQITENTMALIYETNLDEAGGAASPELLLWVLGALAASALLVARVRRASGGCPRRDRLLAALAVALPLLLGPRPAGMRGLHMSLLPVSILANSNVYFREERTLGRLMESRRDLAREAPARFAEEGLTVVLVIGEAARSANFHFNGYARETSPNLDALDVLSFPDVYSCETNTRYAVPCLMTRGTEADLELPYRETSLVSVFRSLGFATSWLSNQGMFWSGSLVQRKFTVTATAAIAREAENVVFINKSGDIDFSDVRDENLLAPFEAALGPGGDNRLVVVHLAGSHWH